MKKRISAIIISLALAAACLAGCGDSGDSGDSSLSVKTSSEADTSTSADSQTEKDDSEDDTSDGKDVSEDGGTGSDLPVENTGYDRESFYKALDEEYQKYGISDGRYYYVTDGYKNYGGTILNKDGVVLDIGNNPELNTIYESGDEQRQERGKGSYSYKNGYWYYNGPSLISSKIGQSEEVFAQLDLQGNILNKIFFNAEKCKAWGFEGRNGKKEIKSVDSHGLNIIYANPDGDAIVSCKLEFEGNGNELIWLYIAKGSNNPVQIPAPENSDFDSLHECAGYKNKYYARSSKKYYCLDMIDLSWTELDLEDKSGDYLTVGRFLFSCNHLVKEKNSSGDKKKTYKLSTDKGFVYDMETDTIIADNPVCYDAMVHYRGGDSIIVPVQLNDNEKTNVCELKLPFDKCDENASPEKITLYLEEDEDDDDRVELKGYEIIKDYGSEIAENLPRGSLIHNLSDNISKMCYVYVVYTEIDSKHGNSKYYSIDFSSGTPVEKLINEYNS